MKNTFLLFVILISAAVSVNSTSICMEKNSTIGTIDTLMIARSLFQQGYKNIHRDISTHQFTVSKWAETKPTPLLVRNPYCITHTCSRHENSALSDQVFQRLNKMTAHKMTLTIKNEHNQYNNAIDECTRYMPINDSDDVKVIAAFYDKKDLIKTLNALRTYENK